MPAAPKASSPAVWHGRSEPRGCSPTTTSPGSRRPSRRTTSRVSLSCARDHPSPSAGARSSRAGRASPRTCDAAPSTSFSPIPRRRGGLSESRRIGWEAQDLGIRLIPHGWNTAIGLAADLQLSAALASTDLVEYKTGSAYVDDLVAGEWRLDADGYLDIPSDPGLGVSLDPEAVEKYGTRPAFADPKA
jgi:hypothetical protein